MNNKKTNHPRNEENNSIPESKELKPTIIEKLKERDMFSFGKRNLIVGSGIEDGDSDDVKNLKVQGDVKKLKVRKEIKGAILTGFLRKPSTKKGQADYDPNLNKKTVIHIISALIRADYGYETILCIFFNEHLQCSFRIVDKKEETLKKFVTEALDIIRIDSLRKDRRKLRIELIKETVGLKAYRRANQISEYILDDLIKGGAPAGKGFIDEEKDIIYYFHKENKTLMEIYRRQVECEFYYFIRDRFNILHRDYIEIRDRIITEIQLYGQRIRAYKSAYYDNENHMLYISNHDNEIYKLNGKKIEKVDNGMDGVFFEFTPEYEPFDIDVENLEGIDYFENGFSPEIFRQKESYLRRYLIDKTNFAKMGGKKGLTVENQKDLFVIYFYSLFFESLLVDKPIAVFVGLKATGKSTLAAMLGKVLFGSRYSNSTLPDNARDLITVLSDNCFICFDNVDHRLPREIMDILCACIESVATKRRTLFTDRDISRLTPHVFMLFTTREAKFKRDDFVSRLLLFDTKKLRETIPKEELYGDIRNNWEKIMEEVLVNLNAIVALLREAKDYKPRCISRLADWEGFGMKVSDWQHGETYFHSMMKAMGAKKDEFALEDDYLYQILEEDVIVKKEALYFSTAQEMYNHFVERAGMLKIMDFARIYRSQRSVANRLKNIKSELNEFMEFKTVSVRGGRLTYRFAPLEEEEIKERKEPNEEEKKSEATTRAEEIREKHRDKEKHSDKE